MMQMLSHANGQDLLKSLEKDRITENSLCDFVLRVAERRDFKVHKCILGVSSEFFRKAFTSNVAQTPHFFVFPESVPVEIVTMIVDYIYGKNIKLTAENSYQLLEITSYFEIISLQKCCIEFLLNNLSLECALKTWKYANAYDNDNFLDRCEKFVANNLQVLLGAKRYLSFDFESFKRFVKLKVDLNLQESLYESISNWISHDKKARGKYFNDLSSLINTERFSEPFLQHVFLPEKQRFSSFSDNHLRRKKFSKNLPAYENKRGNIILRSQYQSTPIMPTFNNKQQSMPNLKELNRPISSEIFRRRNKIHGIIKEALKETKHTPIFPVPKSVQTSNLGKLNIANLRMVVNADEFVVIGGAISPNSIKTFNVLTKNWKIFPNLQNRTCIDVGLAFTHKSLYVLGGRTKDFLEVFKQVHCIEFKDNTHTIIEVECMLESRYNFGCTVSDHKIYVAGGITLTGKCLNTVECFSVSKNEWEEKPELCRRRGGCCLIDNEGVLYVIGGRDGSKEHHRSVECLNGFQWKMNIPMIARRSDLAVVVLEGCIYAIGGKASEDCYNGSVEKREAGSWKYVGRLNVPRAGHSACVLEGKIYVIGGKNGRGPVTSMEVYDPEKNSWEIFGDLIGDPVGVSMISTSIDLFQ